MPDDETVHNSGEEAIALTRAGRVEFAVFATTYLPTLRLANDLTHAAGTGEAQ